MKNKSAIIATAIALVAIMIVGATLAWFTSTDDATNVITIGNIKIDIKEHEGEAVVDNRDGKPDSGSSYSANPGDTLAKDPFVINDGANDAYVRLLVRIVGDGTVYGGLSTDKKDVVDTKLAALLTSLNYDVDNWSQGANVVKGTGADATTWLAFYYIGGTDGVLPAATAGDPNPQTAPLFTQVEIPEDEWGNEMAGIGFNILIHADGIQSENFLTIPVGSTFDDVLETAMVEAFDAP